MSLNDTNTSRNGEFDDTQGKKSRKIVTRTSQSKSRMSDRAQSQVSLNYDQIAQELMDSGEISTIEVSNISNVVFALQNIRNSKISQGNVDEAEKADQLIEKLKEMRNSQAISQIENKRISGLQNRLKQSQDELASLKNRITNTYNGIMNHHQKQMAHLEEKQKKEIDNFVNSWNQPEKRRRFVHLSPNLNELVNKSNLLLSTRRYDDHRVLQTEIGQRIQEETEVNSRLMREEYDLQYSSLAEKHRMEQEHLCIAHKNREDSFNIASANQVEILENRIKKLEKQIADAQKSEFVWNLHIKPSNISQTRLVASQTIPRQKTSARSVSSLALPLLGPPRNIRGNTVTFSNK